MGGIGSDMPNKRTDLTPYAGTMVIAAFLAGTVVLWGGSPARGAYLPLGPIEIPEIGDIPDIPAVVDLLIPEKRKQRNKDSRISDGLRKTQAEIEALLAQDPGADPSVLSVPSFRYVKDDGDIHMYVHFDEFKKHLMDKLEAGGLFVEHISERMSVVQGWASYEDLDKLSRVPGVSRLSLPGYGICNEMSVIPEFTREGQTALLDGLSGTNPIPEPAMLSLLAVGGLALIRRRK